MSSVFILKDPLYNESTSKLNNFTLEWIKWYRFAKIAPKKYKIGKRDIVIINLGDSSDPCKGYDIHPNCKRIFIVHKLTTDNIKHLITANHVVYINDVLRQIAEISGIFKPYTSCPRYPLYEFFGTKFNKYDYAHIGGWFFQDRVDGLYEALNEFDLKLPNNIQFNYNYVWGGISNRKQQAVDFIDMCKNKDMTKNRPNMFRVKELSYNMNLFHIRTSKYGFIHRNSLSIEHTFDLITDKNEKLLNYNISESSMLSMYQSSDVDVICNDSIDCLPYFNKTETFTFKDFSDLITEIIKKLS